MVHIGSIVASGNWSKQPRLRLNGIPVAVLVTTAMLLAASGATAQSPKITDVPNPGTHFNSTGTKPSPSPAEEWMMRSPDGKEAPVVKGKEIEINFAAGARKSARAWAYTCNSHEPCRLADPTGTPIVARYVAWTISNIQWQPGLGWPVFTTVCPDPNYDHRMMFRDHHPFQILPVFGGYSWLGCNVSASGTGNRPTDVVFWVNDFPGSLSDNAGTYDVTIWAYW